MLNLEDLLCKKRSGWFVTSSPYAYQVYGFIWVNVWVTVKALICIDCLYSALSV